MLLLPPQVLASFPQGILSLRNGAKSNVGNKTSMCIVFRYSSQSSLCEI